MKLKKIIAAVAAAATAVSTMAISAFAANVDVCLVTQDNVNWANITSDSVNISGDGEYTLSLSGLSIDPETMNVLYMKDASCIESTPANYESDFPKDAVIGYKSLKINGKEIEIDENMWTTMTEGKKTVFDFCFVNVWDKNYIELPVNTIETVELTFTVTGADGAAAPAASEAPAADSTTTSSGTGNASSAAILSVIAVSGIAALVSRKRK